MKQKGSTDKITWICLLALGLTLGVRNLLQAQTPPAFSLFSLQEVSLLPGPFKDAQLADMRYMLALDPDRLLAPYLREAGLTPKKPSYGKNELKKGTALRITGPAAI